MRERPILFSGAMVRAILAGAKTQTRRIAKPQPDVPDPYVKLGSDGIVLLDPSRANPCDGAQNGARYPYGVPGDELWVREKWQHIYGVQEQESWEMPHITWFEVTDWIRSIPKAEPKRGYTYYAADGHYEDDERAWPWRPSIHMPRWASRIQLRVTGVRIERLQEITDADALAEGVSSRDEFRLLWDSINGKRAPWSDNQWVWVVEFVRVTEGVV